jgi:hypothetical protein
MQSPPFPRYLVPPRSKYSLLYLILNLSQWRCVALDRKALAINMDEKATEDLITKMK